MKIPQKNLSYEEVMKLPRYPHKDPKRPSLLLNAVIRLVAMGDLAATHFTYTKVRMEEAGKGPWLILMNHSSFIDLEIVSKLMFPKRYSIICTSDGFVGKPWLMYSIGCIPTNKFVTDIRLIFDMEKTAHMGNSILMYPEASYTFDGCATPLPRRLGILVKKLGLPVVMITTHGAFARDPLYNCLQKRNVKVSAEMKLLLSASEIKETSSADIDKMLDEAFTFNAWDWQEQNGVEITESFRADGLNRILYKCPHCGAEGTTEGKGTGLTCENCGAHYELDTLGRLVKKSADADSAFTQVPAWYNWEREEVKKELAAGIYRTETEVDVAMLVDFKSIYYVGSGTLVHDNTGFHLNACDGKLVYDQNPRHSYSVYSDYYWYEIGDVISIGTNDCLYYCFPKKKDIVAKVRLAGEELFKMAKATKQ